MSLNDAREPATASMRQIVKPLSLVVNHISDSFRALRRYIRYQLPTAYLCMAQRKCESLSPSLSMNGFFLAGLKVKACFD